jgi:hypothetical protein
MKGQWKTRVLQPANLSAELAAGDDAEVLLLESSYLQSSDTRKLVWRYLTNRRGVLLVVNRVTPGVIGALRELGFEASDAIAARDGGEKFSYVFTGHPIFHPFLSPDFGNLLGIKVSKYFRLKSNEAMPLIFGESGEALFFQGTKMQGKLFVIGFGLDREHTSWPIDQTFIPFLDLALQAARTVDPEPTNFEPGEINPFSLTANESAVEVQLSQRGAVQARAAVEQGKAKLRMPDQPGLYTLTGKGVRERILSVNSSPKESELNYVESPDALKVWQVTPSPGSGRTAESRTAATLAGILPQRYWWWMMLGGLLMLTLEMAATELKGKR